MNYYKKYTPYLFLLPAAAVLIVFFFIPFFQTFGLSFFDYSSSLYNPNFVGADNYIKLFKEPVFYKVMFNTFMYLVIAVPFLVTFPLFLAILINQKIRGITLYKILLYLPVIVSIVVAAIAFKWLYAGQGILNYILSLFHIKSIGWLVDTKWALFSVALVTIWKGIGYYMMIYLASLMSVPQDLYEACDIDGANFITKHLTVTIPHIMPTIALVSTISTISAMKVFAEIYVMTKGGPLNSTKTIVYYIYERAFENLDLGYASALAVVLLVVVMGFSLINILFFERNKYTDI
ncbi:TPA: sugar ABC transporter permease [Candidatus Gastranaerophilales bacterium HUM_3]|jgi:putative chitobiose transport system permease protein|nr:MAG: lactose ABC transporter permease [Acinetobacter sp. CAG:196_36_41]CCZ50297.1 aBC transporter permease protein putative [Acinetobacter sp. CAG:196]DAA84429.1 MAG TPA: sugar ABC transporter permease [Candidatus Gastranaerophilales bacterium HUM_3]DAA84982.1 MAG TPA: sugar ABC transporter permease [Candidatus Gastranaerophilales bacterium HUM_4]DAA90928.1 MAG TPA: sugar ABC transporter permease [Candidatus Gastranaerophilales bacterium HUM_5]DAA94406.1 MAG TPA: sugar ABC transporter perme